MTTWSSASKAGSTSRGEEQIADYRRASGLTDEQVAKWADVLQGRQNWLASHGIRYLFVIPPNKVSIYPEYLPDTIVQGEGPTRLDQLVAYLKENTRVEFLDLRPPFRDAKSRGVLFYPNNTHWNDLGGIIAYQHICHRLQHWFPEIQPLSIDDFATKSQLHVGDLGYMIGLPQELALMAVNHHPLVPRLAQKAELTLDPRCNWPQWVGYNDPMAMETKGRRLKLLAFHLADIQQGQKATFCACGPLERDTPNPCDRRIRHIQRRDDF